jgi:CheY-like chemotaxis protein
MPIERSLERELKEALDRLYDPVYLRQSRLVRLLGLQDSGNVAEALRAVIARAVEDLRPQPGLPPMAKSLRTYEILSSRYVQQFTQQDVAHQLGISIRHLRREQIVAVRTLANLLRDRFGLDEDANGGDSEEREAKAAPSEGAVGLEQELAWLGDSLSEHVTRVEATLRECLGLAQTLANRYAVDLVLDLPERLPPVAEDETVLKQLILNLVTTAIHCVPGGEVSGAVRTAGAVSTAPASRRENGEVTVHIKATPATSGASQAPDKDALEMAQHLAKLLKGRLTIYQAQFPLEAVVALSSAEQITVMAVEDNTDTLQLWERYLQNTRFELVSVTRPQEAIETACRIEPQIIILDVMMPGVDGWTLLRQLCNHTATCTVPIIVCTVLPQEELALSLGARAFIRKPVTRQAFRAALERQIEA